MACFSGNISEIRGDFGGGFIVIDDLVTSSITTDVTMGECTKHGDTSRRFIPILTNTTAEATFNLNHTDPGQNGLRGTLFPLPATFPVEYEADPVTGGAPQWNTADATVTNYASSSDQEDVATLTVSFQFSDVTVTTPA